MNLNIESRLVEYNKSVLVDIGCSDWVKYLDYFPSSDYQSFKIGTELAFRNLTVAGSDVWECVENLKDMGYL